MGRLVSSCHLTPVMPPERGSVVLSASPPALLAGAESAPLDDWSSDSECDRLLLLPDTAAAAGNYAAPDRHGGKNSTTGSLRVCGWVLSVRWLAVALSMCALCLLLAAASRRPARTGGTFHASLLYSERTLANWRLLASVATSTATSLSPPFPSLSSLLSDATAAPPSPPSLSSAGLSSFARCVGDSSASPHVAVVSTLSPHPTAAMLSVASFGSGWCVIVLAEAGGATWKDWTSDGSRAAALIDYDRTLSSVAPTAAASHSSALSSSAFSRLSYIDRLEQRSLPYSVADLVASSQASVRHLGYLLAMHAGAAAILDLHDRTVYLPSTAYTGEDELPYERQAAHFPSAQPFTRQALQRTDDESVSVSVLNPYPLYGEVHSWPRGLPLSRVGATLPSSVLAVDGVCLANSSQPTSVRRLCRPVVQHFLAGHYADVDGAYVSTRSSARRLPFDFLAPAARHTKPHTRRSAPAIAVPAGTYMPFNARSTLFLPDAYAALALPNTRQPCMADIARSYVLQTLLTYSSQQQQAEQCVIVAPPHFAHVDNGSSVATASQDWPSTASVDRLLGWLALRQYGGGRQMAVQAASPRPSELLQWLYGALHEAGELEDADMALVRAWLSDVSRLPHSPLAERGQSVAASNVGATESSSRNASSSPDCFPSYSLPSIALSAPSAPLNLPAQPDAILASDGRTYSLSDYADGFLFPDKYAAGVLIDERPLHYADASSVKPAGRWLPYPPHRHPAKPRVDFILRAFGGYSPLTSALLRSMDSFVPWRQLGEVIVVLDDSDADRQYASSLPDDVRVHFEPKPAFFAEWGTAVQQTGALGVARQANGYALGLYSNWVSDRYSSADYICVLDPDMLFVGRASLPLMFDWDEAQQLYRPVWICRDTPEPIFVDSSYALFGLNQSTAPGCMFQLPVCVHRATLKRVRMKLNEDFSRANSSDYASYGLDPAVDRDSDYEQYGRQYDAKRAEAGSLLPAREGGVAPSAFDRTYMQMVNRDLGHAVCQFCVWGSFILLQPDERRLYSLHLQGNKDNSSECPQIRAATHSGYLVPLPKMSPAYYQLADRLLMEGACHSALPSDCIVPLCSARSQWYDAMSARSAASGVLSADVLRQELLYKWELQGMFLDGDHDRRCKPYAMAAAQQLYEWVQQFDLTHRTRRDRHCQHVALTD